MADEQQGQDGLLTVRNLLDSGSKSPLREFSGKLDSITPGKFGKNDLNFANVEVFETAPGEVYNFPTAIISIKPSNRKESGWGIFGQSLVEFLNEDEDIMDAIGLVFRMKLEVGHAYGGKDAEGKPRSGPDGKPIVGDAWHVIELEGRERHVPVQEVDEPGEEKVTKSPKDSTAEAKAKELLDGKTLAEFNKLAYAATEIRKDAAFQRTITDQSFVKAMIATGLFTVDKNKTHHKTEG